MLGGFLKARRTELGLSRSWLADALRLTVQAVSSWERDDSVPNASHLVELSRILQCDLATIVKLAAGCDPAAEDAA